MLSQNDTVTLNAISSAKKVDLPNGYAWKNWDDIKALSLRVIMVPRTT
jgi:hypothetical protein